MMIWFELNENPSNLLVSNSEVVGQVNIFQTSKVAGTLRHAVHWIEWTMIHRAWPMECTYYFDYRRFRHYAACIFCVADLVL